MNIAQNWKLFEGWIIDHCPSLLSALNRGADEARVKHAESLLGINFPDDVRAFYLLHDGQNPQEHYLFEGSEFLSLDRMVDEWSVWKDLSDAGNFAEYKSTPSAGVRNDWWNNGWIPFTYNGCGDHLCIDMQPAQGGTVGQIIEMWHAEDGRNKITDSLDVWFGNYVEGLLSGRYVYSEDHFGITHKEYLS